MHSYICDYKLDRNSSTDQKKQKQNQNEILKKITHRNRIHSAVDYISSRDAQLSWCLKRQIRFDSKTEI